MLCIAKLSPYVILELLCYKHTILFNLHSVVRLSKFVFIVMSLVEQCPGVFKVLKFFFG